MAGWSGFVLVCNWVETLVVVITLLRCRALSLCKCEIEPGISSFLKSDIETRKCEQIDRLQFCFPMEGYRLAYKPISPQSQEQDAKKVL